MVDLTDRPTGLRRPAPRTRAKRRGVVLVRPSGFLICWINSLSAVAAVITQPVFDGLSDRTRSRWGARRPWVLVGAAIGFVAFLTTGLAPDVAALTDRVPEQFHGRCSTFVGLGVLLVLAPVPDNRSEPRRLFSPRVSLSAFWVTPVRHPGFFWGSSAAPCCSAATA
ncbi:hypothetical protein GTY54_48310 [Streptomyces sp. SID625]|nr:hypothetical protein [Streptomyces sp. SID625]